MKPLRWTWRQLRRVGRHLGNHRVVVAFLIGFAGVFVAVSIAFVAIRSVQAESNRTRCRIVALVSTFTENSRRSYRATIASPTATRQQKEAATTNLQKVTDALALTREQLGHPTGKGCQSSDV